MGNTSSTEASRKSLPSRPPLQQDHPSPFSLPPASPLYPNRLSKPRTRRRSTVSRLRDPDDLESNVAAHHARYSAPGSGLVPSFSPPNAPSSSQLDDSRPLPPSPASPPAISLSVFTFEDSITSVAGQRASGYWQPLSSVYAAPGPDLDIGGFQEQPSRQQDFQQRQRQQFELQRHERSWPSQQPAREPYLDDEEEILQKTKQKPKSRIRSSLFRSRSLRRPAEPHDEHRFRRRNSIGPENPSTGDWHHTWDGGPMTYDQALSQYYGGRIPDRSVSSLFVHVFGRFAG